MADNKKIDNSAESKQQKIIFIGSDTTYYKNLELKYKELSSATDIVFEQWPSNEDNIIQSYLIKINDIKPKLVIIDFSNNSKATLHLARCLLRQNSIRKYKIIGVCEYKQSQSLVIQSTMTGIQCTHIKSSEFESICYDINVLSFPEKVQDHGFATAKMEDTIISYHPAKLSLINENYFRIESNFSMQPKQQLHLNNFWSRKKIINSNLFMCADQSEENLYYNYNFTQVLQLAHANPVKQTAEMTQEDFNEAQAKRQESLEDSKFKLRKWVTENANNSRPKFLKCFVIDKDGDFYNNRPLSDIYSFVYRIQPYIDDCKKELTNIKPQLIIYNMEVVTKEELEANADIINTFNDSRMFQHLIKTVKEVCASGFQPIIIVFNSGEYDSAYMQKVFNYNSILAVKEKINVDLCLKMSEMLKSKIMSSMEANNAADVYIDKSSDISYCEIETELTLLSCSENDVYFNSLSELKLGTVLRINLPVPMYITVAQAQENAKVDAQYYGIIHGIGEEERMELRRHINSIFFRELESNKAKEIEGIEELKEKYKKSKEAAVSAGKNAEEEKKRIEEEEKKKKEDITNKAAEIVGELGDSEE